MEENKDALLFKNTNTYKRQTVVNVDDVAYDTRKSMIDEPAVFTSGLLNQLLGRERQKSKFYNVLLLASFNMNLAQTCFPYLTVNLGIIVTVFLCIICLIIAFFMQSIILDFLTKFKGECNYGKVVENILGNFMAYLVEISSLIWYFTLLLVSSKTIQYTFYYQFPKAYLDENLNTIKIVGLSIIFVIFLVLNTINKPFIIDLYVFLCLFLQLSSFIVYF